MLACKVPQEYLDGITQALTQHEAAQQQQQQQPSHTSAQPQLQVSQLTTQPELQGSEVTAQPDQLADKIIQDSSSTDALQKRVSLHARIGRHHRMRYSKNKA